MRADDVHSDSLAGTELGAPAFSAPPSLRGALRPSKLLRSSWGLAALLVLGAALVRLRQSPDLGQNEELRVEGQTVHYSDGFAARAGIRTVEVREAAFAPIVSVEGKMAFDPHGVAAVDANALGTVRRVLKYEGENVKRGDILAEIGSAGLARIQAASLLRLRAPAMTHPSALGVSAVRSPIEGTVIERRIVTGQSVKGERVVFVVANLDQLVLDLSLDERRARGLSVGDRAELKRDTAAEVFDGRVLQVSDAPDGTDGSKHSVVRVGVDNRARHLRPGQAVSAQIHGSCGLRALLVPNRSLAWIAGHAAVFVARGHNSVSALPVTLGDGNGDQTEVSIGLIAGQRVVSDGVGALKDDSFL